jgi:hypothetical protein
LIIKSSDNNYYNRSLEQLINLTDAGVDFTITTLQPDTSNAATGRFDRVVALGHDAIKHALHHHADSTVLHAYLTKHEHHLLDLPSNHYALLLDQPLEIYLGLVGQLLPGSRVGVIRDALDQIAPSQLEDSERKHGIRLEQVLFSNDGNPVNLARQLLQRNDLLLALPEPGIFNRRTLKGILLATYRLNKPLVSYSPAHVKAGALAAVFTTPEQIGQQLAGLLGKLARQQIAGMAKYRYADQFEIAINRQVARSLGIELDSDDALERNLRMGDVQ